MREWLVVCERTGNVAPIKDVWFVCDRDEQKWLIVSPVAQEMFSDYSLKASDVIGVGDEQINLLLHIKTKLWFKPNDFVDAITRAFRQIAH